MNSSKYRGTLVERILNVNSYEWHRLLLSWVIRFLYRFGFVIGWIVITSMFVARFGITSLPYLFVVNASLIVLGSALYSLLLQRFNRSALILTSIFGAGIFLFMANLFGGSSDSILFVLMILAEALFLVQLSILFEGLFEDMFTPLESERMFPLIESADMLGGLLGGFTMFLLAEELSVSKIIYIWIIALFLIVPLVLKFRSFRMEIVKPMVTKARPTLVSKQFKSVIDYVKRMPFLRALALTVFIHWILVNLVEFQYTRAVYEHVRAFVPVEGSGFEHVLAHDFGTLNMIFYASAFFVQLFVGSRLITALGIVGSMIVYPIIMGLSILGLFVNYGFLTAVITRNNFLVSSVLNKNSYLSSYYIVREDMRAYTRELMEGVIHPLGALCGTFFLIIAQNFFFTNLSMILSVLMLLFVFALFYLYNHMKRTYTKMASYALVNAEDAQVRINAIDILSQKGHANTGAILIGVLMDDAVQVDAKVKILELLKESAPAEFLPALLQIVKSPNKQLAIAALRVMDSLDFQSHDFDNIFSAHELSQTLLNLFKRKTDLKFRRLILQILVDIPHFDSVSFISNLLKKRKQPALLFETLAVCASWGDPYMKRYVEPFTKHSSDRVKAQSIAALWQISGGHDEILRLLVVKYLANNDPGLRFHMLKALMSCPNIDAVQNDLISLLDDKSEAIRLHAAILLARLGDTRSLRVLLDSLFNFSKTSLELVKLNFSSFHYRIKKLLRKEIHREASSRMNALLKVSEKKRLAVAKQARSEMLDLLSFLGTERDMLNLSSSMSFDQAVRYVLN